MFTVNNCLFPGNRTSLSRTANLKLQWCEDQKASPSERFIYGRKWRIWRLTLWLLANCSSPWSERKDLCHISIVTRRVMVGTELRSCVLGAFLGLSARLFLQRAVWKKPPVSRLKCRPLLQQPQGSGHGSTHPTSLKTGWKMTNYLRKGQGEKTRKNMAFT